MELKTILWIKKQLDKFPVIIQKVGLFGLPTYKRWAIFESSLLNIYVDFIAIRNRIKINLAPDKTRWHAFIYNAAGSYTERIYDDGSIIKDVSRQKGTISFRKAGLRHLVIAHLPTWIVILTGPKIVN